MVQGHKGHDQAAEEIDGVKTWSGPYKRLFLSGDGPKRS
jgi:hypothetical protein